MLKHITRAFSAVLFLATALAGLPTSTVHATHGYQGPMIFNIDISDESVFLGDTVTVTARVASGDYEGSAYPKEAGFTIDGGSWFVLWPIDGAWDSFVEDVSGSYTTTTLGSNDLCISALDWDGWWTDQICGVVVVYPPPDLTGPVTSAVGALPDPALSGGLVTVTATVDDTATGGSNISSAEFNVNGGSFTAMTASDGTFDGVSEGVTGSFTAAVSGLSSVCVRGTDANGNVGTAACIDLTVESGYMFGGFLQPVDTAGTKAKAGHKFSLRFTLTATDGSPVSDPGAIAGVMSYAVDCTTLAGDASSAVSESGPGNPDLDYLGNGIWIFKWQLPNSYGGACRVVFISLSDSSMSPGALFQFK
jgi:hypothetical protein